MLPWIASALAHPFGAHQATHHLEWTLTPTHAEVRLVVDVPHAYVRTDRPDPLGSLARELGAGLQLQVDGHTVPLSPTASAEPAGDGVRVEVRGAAPLDARAHTLELVDGNLMHTPPVIRVDTHVDPAWAVDASSLWVEHEGRVVRTDSGRLRKGDAFRTTSLTVRPTGLLERLHARARGERGPRSDLGARILPAREIGGGNRSTPAFALLAVLVLPGVGAASGRPPWPVRVGWIVVGLVDLALPPDALALPAAFVAAVVTGVSGRWPAARAWVGPLLGLSLDVTGAACAVIALQGLWLLRRSEPGPWEHTACVLAAGLACALQAARAY